MNTIDKWITTATIHDPRRRAVWIDVFPNATVPVKSALPIRVDVPGHPNALAYMLDLGAITKDQREGLIKTISREFKIPLDEVRKDIDCGVPILAEGVTIGALDERVFFDMFHVDQEEDVP